MKKAGNTIAGAMETVRNYGSVLKSKLDTRTMLQKGAWREAGKRGYGQLGKEGKAIMAGEIKEQMQKGQWKQIRAETKRLME